MALICKEPATGATLDQVLGLCSSRWPIESYTEGLAYKSSGCGVMIAESGMNFCQKVPPFLFGDAPLKDFGSALFCTILPHGPCRPWIAALCNVPHFGPPEVPV